MEFCHGEIRRCHHHSPQFPRVVSWLIFGIFWLKIFVCCSSLKFSAGNLVISVCALMQSCILTEKNSRGGSVLMFKTLWLLFCELMLAGDNSYHPYLWRIFEFVNLTFYYRIVLSEFFFFFFKVLLNIKSEVDINITLLRENN